MKRISIIVFFMIIIGNIAVSLQAQPQIAVVYDFNAPGPWTPLSGVWEVKDGVYDAPATDLGYHERTWIGERPWEDYTVETQFRFLEWSQVGGSNEAHLYFRWTEQGYFGVRVIKRAEWLMEYLGHTPEFQSGVIAPLDRQLTFNNWYGIRVDITGHTFNVDFFDGSEWFQVGTLNFTELDSGGIGLGKSGAHVQFDYVRVYGEGIVEPVFTVFEKVSGDNQQGRIGSQLPEPLVVQILNQFGEPMKGVLVNFAVTQGDGSINPTSALTSALTDADGKASTELTLGKTAGLNEVTATVDGLSVVFSATGQAQPRIIYVDVANTSGIEDGSQEHPFNTIQEGIDATLDWDTVIVADGIYTGDGNKNLDFNGKNIIVTSENGAESTIIDCENDGRGFYFHSGETSEAVVSGFTIRNGYVTDEGGGIHCDNNSSPMITNNIIEGNTADHSGGGIGLYNSSPKIINNIITSNSSDYVGGGISCWDYCSPEITNNVIAGNTASNGGGIYCETSSSPAIINSTITANTGYGIYCYDNSSPVVVNTILWNETPDEIYLSGGSTITITYSDIKGGWTGEGNIDADPLFVDPESGDYHLQASSPCIDAGDPNSPKDPDGTIADMGALYYDQSGIPIPTTLEKVSGDNQIGFVGTTLPNPLVVRVLDQNGEPMEGITVNFESSGGATVNPTQATTNENGQAQTILTLGTLSGGYNVTVSVEGLEPVVFTATAIESEKPIIFSIHPNYGYIIGGTEITITGANFQDGATVTIGGRLAQDVTTPEETSAWLTSDHIDITDEAPENVQLLITLDEGVGPTTETITFSTSGISLAQVQVETTSLEVLRIIIQTAIDNRFGTGKITVSVSGSDTTARVTFTTVAIGADVRLSIEQQVGSDILFSEPMISSGLQIHATTPEGTIGPKAVVVTNPDGESATYPKGFVYLPLTGDVSGDGTISAYDAALILQFVVGIIDVFPADSPIAQAAQKYISGEVSIEELDRLLQKLGYPSIFKLLVVENQLLQNFPNPFNPETWIPYKLTNDTAVTINIYDTKGQLIHNISLGTKQAGIYATKDRAAYWNGRDSLGQKVSSGIYFYTLEAGEFRATRKMVIMK